MVVSLQLDAARPTMTMLFYASQSDAWLESGVVLGAIVDNLAGTQERQGRKVAGPLAFTIAEAARMKIGSVVGQRNVSGTALMTQARIVIAPTSGLQFEALDAVEAMGKPPLLGAEKPHYPLAQAGGGVALVLARVQDVDQVADQVTVEFFDSENANKGGVTLSVA